MKSEWYHGVTLIVLMGAFIGVWIWAWSRKRKKTFDQASLLPLEEDDGYLPANEEKKD
jgi:cytochrome c oxidase cbb3-type subunit 4